MSTFIPQHESAASTAPVIDHLDTAVFQVPTDEPEADGTLEWDSTTMVVVRVRAGGREGIGYTYGHGSLVGLIDDKLAAVVVGRDALAPEAATYAMARAVRNSGLPGMCAMAISAVDIALWDLKAKLLDASCARLMGMHRDAAPIYGSGGFTSYDDNQLSRQLAGWVEQGIPRVKMKVGRDASADPHRVRTVRRAIGEKAALFVDANGAYRRKTALTLSRGFHEQGRVTWFEEPRPSDDLAGLHALRESVPAGMEVAAGEYGYDLPYFRRMLEAQAVDVLQIDATRACGFSGFRAAAALAESFGVQVSSHCAPAVHLSLGCSVPNCRHMEYFHDHVRIESMFFDGAPEPVGGCLSPDAGRPGLGIALKWSDARPYRIGGSAMESK